MRIALFSDNFYPEIGGVQDSVACLGRELGRRGLAFCYYVPQCSSRDFIKAKLPVGEINLGDNVKIKRFFSLPVKSSTQQSRLVVPNFLRWREVKKFKPDIIHSHSFFGLGLEALAAARFLKIPIVGTNHWVITEFNQYSPAANKLFAGLSLKYVIWYFNRCDFVTAPSQTVFTEMLKHGFNRPHRVVSNQIDLKIFKSIKEDRLKLKAEFKISEKTVVYAGRLGREKNVDTIVRAIALAKKDIPDINLAIAGHGSAESGLKVLVKELGLGNEVKFFGTMDQPKLARLYNAAEVFAIASTSESQSMVLLQAMACGLPVVGARWRALPEYINEQNGYLFKPHDFKELAGIIIKLLVDSEARKLLGQGGLDFVRKFSAEHIASVWEKIYSQVLTKKNNFANNKIGENI
ncbi:hypothetical protein A3H09_03130 [Candidatus Falkowbacteria bacterium RIFCSPLOWO2_12_FULL_45_13]|uniref:Glycosyl transferase family 1 n=1 Tax=Candidatus Falkowbacteria bacterium RIFCSPLOWO2_12_FULL_45_13 TaxID=1797991 RepID=A0A1F5SZD0_9BACT|nr:MAG: hypothetical protein A3H09_03130 [Candidatus Falkowbacteria bacterium RIFCSPLOWO2_12_FULL_45_13]